MLYRKIATVIEENLTSAENYGAKKAYVLSNERRVFVKDKIIYLPIYDAMFL